MVTWANFHYKDFVLNWVDHLKATGCSAFIVGARDWAGGTCLVGRCLLRLGFVDCMGYAELCRPPAGHRLLRFIVRWITSVMGERSCLGSLG